MGIRTVLIGQADMPDVDDLLRTTFYVDEPLIATNGVGYWENGLHFRLVPDGVSVKTVDEETGRIVGAAVNDPKSIERRIYNDSPQDMKYRLRIASPIDGPAIHDFFLHTLYREEPLIATNPTRNSPSFDDSLTLSVVTQGISVVAMDSTGRVVGAVLNDVPPQEFEFIYTGGDDDRKFQVMFEHIEEASRVLTVAPGAVEIRFLAVDAAWRGRGVAQALVQASAAVARQAGFRWIKIYCTSAYTDSLMRKLGWTRLYSLSYKEYVTEYGSEIKIPEEPHTHCHLYVSDLTAEVS